MEIISSVKCFDKDGREYEEHTYSNGKKYYTWEDWGSYKKRKYKSIKIKINKEDGIEMVSEKVKLAIQEHYNENK